MNTFCKNVCKNVCKLVKPERQSVLVCLGSYWDFSDVFSLNVKPVFKVIFQQTAVCITLVISEIFTTLILCWYPLKVSFSLSSFVHFCNDVYLCLCVKQWSVSWPVMRCDGIWLVSEVVVDLFHSSWISTRPKESKIRASFSWVKLFFIGWYFTLPFAHFESSNWLSWASR